MDAEGELWDSPSEEDSSSKSGSGTPGCSGCVAAVSNFSIQYNYACASIATQVMLSHNDHTGTVVADFREPHWAKETLLSIVFIGSVVGMLTMGYLGDLLGIRRALLLTNSLTVLGAVASALLSWGGAQGVWSVIAVSRFVLGVGVGGNYPLSAAKASESTPSAKEAMTKAADAFFWQGPGSCAPYLLGLLLLLLPSSDERTSIQFRILLGAGALPSLVVLWAAMGEPHQEHRPQRSDHLGQALARPEHWKTLFGTAGTWFLFDVAFYGNVIFAPTILSHVFGKDQSLSDLAWHAAFLSFLGILGTMGGVMVVHCVGPKLLNTVGLAVSGVLFAAFALVFSMQGSPWVLFSLLCLIYFVLYFSANIATYLLPVMSFPRDVRSTFHGLSAAAAKVGAMLGALLFPVVDHHFGTVAVMCTQASVCLAGALLCQLCVDGKGVRDADGSESELELSSWRG